MAGNVVVEEDLTNPEWPKLRYTTRAAVSGLAQRFYGEEAIASSLADALMRIKKVRDGGGICHVEITKLPPTGDSMVFTVAVSQWNKK
jgi:hypothetical protein